MTREDFLSHIDTYVKEATVSDLTEIFTSPPGRNPDKILKTIADWRASLQKEDIDILGMVIEETVKATLFSLFSVIDGSRSIDKGIDRFIISTRDTQGITAPIANTDFDLHSHFAPD
ncbi:hypothetical protein [Pseudomonas monteilii]|uniref:hypothetical protein n=1 Tax=Pseudomonas monteilii TaxID=76759 RepID=UPI0006DA89D0|nr:hypothetical protein [Pseudomonas monteilii]KPM63212.1 hypothetical protein HB4184_14380 [Pseudomonas putida]